MALLTKVGARFVSANELDVAVASGLLTHDEARKVYAGQYVELASISTAEDEPKDEPSGGGAFVSLNLTKTEADALEALISGVGPRSRLKHPAAYKPLETLRWALGR